MPRILQDDLVRRIAADRRGAMIQRMREAGRDLDEERLADFDDIERRRARRVDVVGKPAAARRNHIAIAKRSFRLTQLFAIYDDDVLRGRRTHRNGAPANRQNEMSRREIRRRHSPVGICGRADNGRAVAKLTRHHAEGDPGHYASSAMACRRSDAARSTLYPLFDSGFAS